MYVQVPRPPKIAIHKYCIFFYISKSQKKTSIPWLVNTFVHRTTIKCDQSLISSDRVNIQDQDSKKKTKNRQSEISKEKEREKDKTNISTTNLNQKL